MVTLLTSCRFRTVVCDGHTQHGSFIPLDFQTHVWLIMQAVLQGNASVLYNLTDVCTLEKAMSASSKVGRVGSVDRALRRARVATRRVVQAMCDLSEDNAIERQVRASGRRGALSAARNDKFEAFLRWKADEIIISK